MSAASNPPTDPIPPNDSAGAPQPSGPATPIKKRKKRRFLKGIIVLFVLVLALVGAAPYLVSTSTGVKTLLGLVNDRINGDVAMEDLSLSWTGPTELRGIRVLDDGQHEVLKVDKLVVKSGVWGLITSAVSFGRIDAESPHVVLILDRDGTPSLVRALSLRKPSPPSGGPLPDVRGKIVITGGTIRALHPDGAAYDVPGVDGEIELTSLSNMIGKVDLKLADGTHVTGDADLRELVRNGEFRPANGSGTLTVKSSGPVAIGPAMAVFAPNTGLDGSVTLDVKAATQGGETTADFKIAGVKLVTPPRGGMRVAPIDMTLSGHASRKGDEISGKGELGGDVGSIKADVNYTLSDKGGPNAQEILSAMLSGKTVNLPEFRLDARGNVDLARLAKAVPGILKVREGEEITAGQFEITSLSARGGASPSAKGSIAIKDLAAVNAGHSVRVQPITVKFDAAVPAGEGLKVQSAELQSSFAGLSAHGTPSDLSATFQANLAKMRDELGQVFDLSALRLAGELSGEARMTKPADDRLSLVLTASTKGLHYGDGKRDLDLGDVAVKSTGVFTLVNNTLRRAEFSETSADMGGRVVAASSGWYDFDKGAFSATTDLRKGDLAYFAPRAAALGLPELAHYGGSLVGKATAERAGADQPLQSSGSFVATGVTVDGKPALDGESKIGWTGMKMRPGGDQVDLDSAMVDCSAGKLDAKTVHWGSGTASELSADVTASADLVRLFKAVGALSGAAKPPAIGGRLAVSARVASSGAEVTMTGKGGVDDLVVGEGAGAVREKRLDLDFDSKLDSKQQKLSLTKARLTSGLLNAEATGSIEQFNTTKIVSIRGKYDTSWEKLLALLHELSPASADTVIIKGKCSSDFEINGPLNQPGAKPAFRGASGTVAIAWDSADLVGLQMGAVRLQPALRDGQLTVPPASAATASGKVNFRGMVDFGGETPVFKAPGVWKIVENVPVTPQFSRSLLSRINPIFMFLAQVEGKVNLDANDLNVPLGEAMKRNCAGKGALDLHEMKLQPAGFLGELCQLAGVTSGGLEPVEFSKVDFVLKDGRLFYDNFAMTFSTQILPLGGGGGSGKAGAPVGVAPGAAGGAAPKVTIKFSGSVGLDDTLDLIISLPLSSALIERLGIRLPPMVGAEQLNGLSVDIPLGGTRQNPKLDFSKIKTDAILKQLAKNVLPGKAIENAADIIKPGGPIVPKLPGEDIIKGILPKPPPPAPKDEPAAPPKAPSGSEVKPKPANPKKPKGK